MFQETSETSEIQVPKSWTYFASSARAQKDDERKLR